LVVLELQRPTIDAEALVSRWQLRLGLAAWEGRLERISPFQVCGEDGAPGQELVGVVTDARRFAIVHTRALDEHDIIHELLHVAFPDWHHQKVEKWTDALYHRFGEHEANNAHRRRS
jgi:hypothetical protein